MYSILCKDHPIGTAEIIEEGLYYRFCCKCTTKLVGINRIMVINRSNRVDLGICVPEKNYFVLNTRIPRKHFKDKSFSFELISDDDYIFNNVYTGMMFDKLDKLEAAHLEIVSGQPQIIINQSRVR